MRRKDPFPGHPPYSAAWTALWVWGRPSPGSCVAGACGQGRGGRTCAESEEGQQKRGPGHGGCAPSSASEPAAALGCPRPFIPSQSLAGASEGMGLCKFTPGGPSLRGGVTTPSALSVPSFLLSFSHLHIRLVLRDCGHCHLPCV